MMALIRPLRDAYLVGDGQPGIRDIPMYSGVQPLVGDLSMIQVFGCIKPRAPSLALLNRT